MCGIVGYVGNKNAQDFLISGLKRLEYRGYDSAGIVTLSESGEPTLLRAKGKIVNLEEKLAKSKRDDKIGIGHTRWATHGEPSETNAHPHQAGPIYLVHNGIIENYKELKATLSQHKFYSETDTEVLAALIESFYKNGEYPLTNAVVQALKLVKGTYGIAVVSKLNPDEIVVARSGSPLVIGVGHDETLIASDASALVGHTKQAIYLNDGEVALIKKDSVEIKTLGAEPVSESLKETLRGRVNVSEGTVHLGGPGLSEAELRKIKHLVIVGCGTAYHAGLLAGYYIEQFTPEITVETVIASEYRYRNAFIPEDSVALIVSQSGETADTLACLREIKKQGIKTIGIVNAIGSTIAREVDGGTYVHVGPEISVASTKAFTSQVIAMVMFGLTIAQAKGVKPGILRPYVNEISKLSDEIHEVLDAVKEVSYIDANAYAFGELKHGPLALIDDRFFEVALLPEGALYDKAVSNVQEVLARGGHIVAVTNVDKFDLPVDDVVKITTSLSIFAPILMNLVSQLFAYYMTVAKGFNVDQPRNLAKSVTVE